MQTIKIKLDQLEFLKAWQMAERSSSTKSTISAVSGILITASEAETAETRTQTTVVRVSFSIHFPNMMPSRVLAPVRSLRGDKIENEIIVIEHIVH